MTVVKQQTPKLQCVLDTNGVPDAARIALSAPKVHWDKPIAAGMICVVKENITFNRLFVSILNSIFFFQQLVKRKLHKWKCTPKVKGFWVVAVTHSYLQVYMTLWI